MINEVPLGLVLSVFLFLVAINDIIHHIQYPLQCCLFIDNLIISLISFNPQRAHRLLYSTMNQLNYWTVMHGLLFSSSKTKFLIFYNRHPSLTLPHFCYKISLSKLIKFLGLITDQHLSWTPHLKLFKASVNDS